MKLVYENLSEETSAEENKQHFKLNFGKLTTSFQAQIEEKTVEILNLKTELLNTKQNLS